MNEEQNILVRIAIVGGRYVGKSFICNQLLKRDSDLSRAGVEFGIRHYNHKNQRLKLQIWDFFTQYDKINIFYSRVHAVIVVFDVNNEQSFEKYKILIEEIKHRQILHQTNQILNDKIIIIGNKATPDRIVSSDEAQEFSLLHNLIYTEISYEAGNIQQAAIDELLVRIINLIFNHPQTK
ncbi:Rab1a [Hexamita inflata]|uniref:Rab1a n=1 Tax=Hexamita inflata TaxID=28002 RepID=A0AA86UQT1_9EUKA|nr:Rab1a [Hexamita inflata]